MIKWKICNLGDQEENQKLVDAVNLTGGEATMVNLGFAADIADYPSDESDIVVTQGSVWFNKSIRSGRPNWQGCFHDKKRFSFSTYAGFLPVAQQKYIYIIISDLIEHKDNIYTLLSVQDRIFIKPDSPEKEFNGELVHKNSFQSWKEHCEILSVSSDTPCVVALPITIQKEVRIIVVDGRIITGSTYRRNGQVEQSPLENEPDVIEIVNFAKNIARKCTDQKYPPYYVIDVAVVDGLYRVMETGCFCCCGLYACNKIKIAKAINEYWKTNATHN